MPPTSPWCEAVPTVFRAHGLRFAIFTLDHAPPHVHVTGRGSARIAIDADQTVMDVKGMTKPDIARAQNVVRAQQSRFLAIWMHYHG